MNGSYEFFGNGNSYIEFNNSDGGVLDVRNSFTMLCWIYYNINGTDGDVFLYGRKEGSQITPGLSFRFLSMVNGLTFFLTSRDFITFAAFFTSSFVRGRWNFVGASYNGPTGETKLWIDGVAVETANFTAGLALGTNGNFLRIGYNLKGMITQMRLYNISLSQEQVQEIMGKNSLHSIHSYSQILQLEILMGNTSNNLIL